MAEVEVVELAVVVVNGVGFVGVRGCGRGCWPRGGLSRVLLAPPAWRYPSGFAGVSFATVLGLGVWWSVLCVFVDALWPLQVSMGQAFRVFEVVGVIAGRGVGRGEGCCWPW